MWRRAQGTKPWARRPQDVGGTMVYSDVRNVDGEVQRERCVRAYCRSSAGCRDLYLPITLREL